MKKDLFKHITKVTSTMFVALALLASCIGNFEDLNMHPTDLYPESMTAIEKVGSLFPTMLYLLNPTHENNNQHTEQMVGGQYGGYFATTYNWDGTNFGTFNPAEGWVAEPFKLFFTEFYPNFLTIKEATKSTGYIYAWANVIRVAVMLRVADTYGPIPYSKMGGGEFTVEYDDVQTLYHNMIEDLTSSANTLTLFAKENSGSDLPIAEYDLIYNGDFAKWAKFANSLKLRMAVRIAGVDMEFAKQAMQEAISGGVIESNSDNAFLPSNDNPYFKASNDWKDLAISATLSTYMSGYNDPRSESYMTKTNDANNPYCGVRMGIHNIPQGIYGNASYYSKPTYTKQSSLPVYYAAETFFLKAEAALKGWIGSADQAKNYYEQGIRISMEQYGTAIGDYLTNIAIPTEYKDRIYSARNFTLSNTPSVSWENGSNKLEKIITQKWIANYPLGFEAWCDYRRTGYPRLILPVNNLSTVGYIGSINNDRLVRRLPYPISEISNNSTNVGNAIVTMLGGDDTGATDLWWAKKN